MEQFHAVICMLNSKYVHSSLAPWYLLAGVKTYCDAGITAEVVEGTVNQDLETIARAIIDKKPNVLGFCCYIWNIAVIRRLLPLVKAALPNTVIVLGGPEVSYNAGEILQKNYSYIGIIEKDENAFWGRHVDYILAGEGERPFALLLNALHANAGGHAGPPLRGDIFDRADDAADVGAALCGRPPVDAEGAVHVGADSISAPVPGDAEIGRIWNPPLQNIPGLCYRREGQVVVNPPYVSAEEPPDPYGPEYFASLGGRIAYIETSRGCPYACAFCLSGAGAPVRWFSLERAKNDIVRLANSGTQTLKFVDRTFNADRARAREIFKFIAENYGKDIPGTVCCHFEIAGDLLDDETLALLAAVPKGAVQFEIGLQSFNAETLTAVCRKTDIGRLKKNIEALVALGNIHIHIDLIAGLPHEDMDTFAQSFNTAYALRPHMLQLGFLKLLHGAAMREKPEAYPCRYSDEPPYEVLDTPWLTTEDLCILHEAEDAVGRLYNSGRFRRTLSYVLEQTQLPPFELFCEAGQQLQHQQGLSLDALTALLLDFFKKLPHVDEEALRDQMVRDRLATNASGKLPAVLKRPYGKLPGQRRGAALLQSGTVLATADYARQDPVTGEYALREVLLS